MFQWMRSDRPAHRERDEVVERSWELSASDTLMQRARKLAEIAYADIHPNATALDGIERATTRIAEALEKYEIADRAERTD